jgi:ABC-type lipoprotein release transport system permease subunit
LSQLLFDIKPHDPLTYAVVVALLGAVALVATWLPARRAARVNPIEVLRAE